MNNKTVKTPISPNPEDSWAMVELYRWQYGHLPTDDCTDKPLIVSDGLKGMADAFSSVDAEDWPHPMNIAAVLRYVSNLVK